ncbi:MAG: type II toxin-antitoxin system RelE/ParE family toxin [Methylocystis sp.]|jgi:toxin ParE1/3/4
MRRLEVRYRPEALDDLLWIYRFIHRAAGSPASADRYVTRIRDKCRRIGDVPYGGRARDDLAPGLRTTPFEKSAVIAYKVEADCVRITNVFYGGRDYESLYRGVAEAESEE